MTPEQEQKLNEVYEFIQSLKTSNSVPFEVDSALRERLLGDRSELEKSSKGATSENKTVDESGSSSYAVLDKPDGFLEVTVSGTRYYIPYYG